jgi:hypothetical protein
VNVILPVIADSDSHAIITFCAEKFDFAPGTQSAVMIPIGREEAHAVSPKQHRAKKKRLRNIRNSWVMGKHA